MAIKIAGTTVIDDNRKITGAESLDLAPLAATIADTAVDVFVYDTSKDSDGGAWRKRTQHTSWYNETLNTATRGSRKEFPAVAVIVAEAGTVTIYDGDDPDLPMWMVFNGASGTTTINMLFNYTNPRPFTCCSMLNAQLVVGTNTNNGALAVIDFIRDNGKDYNGVAGLHYYNGNIEQRNDGLAFGPLDNTYQTVARENNDVAMTVLPNAPIDAATGLPVPTIAVATDGGVSVIKDDGTVVDLTCSLSGYTVSSNVVFGDGGELWLNFGSNVADKRRIYRINEIPSSDLVVTTTVTAKGNADAYYSFDETNRDLYPAELYFLSNTGSEQGDFVFGKAAGFIKGLTSIDENTTTPSEGMVAYTTSSYNTGWMNGSIKLATLSDTDDTDVTEEVKINETFATTPSWSTSGSGAGTWSASGTLGCSGATSFSNYFWRNFSVEAGKTYTATIDVVTQGTRTGLVKIGTTSTGGEIGTLVNTGAAGTYALTFTATANDTYYYTFQEGSSGTANAWDNAIVRLAEEDRSVNGNGLQVFGTVTKTFVDEV